MQESTSVALLLRTQNGAGPRASLDALRGKATYGTIKWNAVRPVLEAQNDVDIVTSCAELVELHPRPANVQQLREQLSCPTVVSPNLTRLAIGIEPFSLQLKHPFVVGVGDVFTGFACLVLRTRFCVDGVTWGTMAIDVHIKAFIKNRMPTFPIVLSAPA